MKQANYYSYYRNFKKSWCTVTVFKLNNIPCTAIQSPNPEYTVWIRLNIDKRKVEKTFCYKTTNYRDLKRYINLISETFQKKETYV